MQLNNHAWVAEQYRTPDNLQARIRLHERFGTNPQRWPHWAFDRILTSGPANVAEIGCGPGSLWKANRARIPTEWQLMLSDLSLGMVQQAAHSLGDVLNISFVSADAQALPFSDASFDILIANHMLYHVPDRGQALREFRRVLRPGGRLYVATNGKDHMLKIRELAESFAPQMVERADLHERFIFEQGQEEIGRLFENVQLHRYENRLIVTDADALADYMLSGTPVLIPQAGETLLRRWLHNEMAKTGQVEIVNDTGLFEAVKAEMNSTVATSQRSGRRRTARTTRSRKDPPSTDE